MKSSKIIISLLAIIILGLSVYIFTGNQDYEKVKKNTPVVTSFTTSPEIPDDVYFCGRRIDLTRYNMYEGLDRELSSFTYFHSSTMMLIKRANRYFPIIEPILKENGIPEDFKYLAVIESLLDPSATSPAHAVGLWQIMEATGKQYGLRITQTVDERRNVAKSTVAACKYLNEAYRKYGDWVAVASSYNAGMGRISGQLERQGEPSVLNLHLVEETSRYPYRIFAIKQIFENPYRYGFVLHAENLYKSIKCNEVIINEDIQDLVAFAKKYDITYHDLKFFNPWLKDSKLITGGASYTVLIPDKNNLYYENLNSCVHDKRWVVK
jgi:hypothetical protein